MSETAAQMNWGVIQHFSPGEWPGDVLGQMSPTIIHAVSDVRNRLPADHRMTPSPMERAHVRQHGTSRHSVQGGSRLSDATDIFMRGGWGQALVAWEQSLRHSAIGGIGFYVNRWLGHPGNVTPMLHFDCRPGRVLWVCRANEHHDPSNPNSSADEYIYLHANPRLFFQVMASVHS